MSRKPKRWGLVAAVPAGNLAGVARQLEGADVGKFDGESYELDFERFRTLAPPVRTDIPIYLPAVFEKAIRLSGEIADGLASHPIWCEQWIREKVIPNLGEGLRISGRSRRDFDCNIRLWVAPGPDKKECIEHARPTVVFYAVHRQYERYFSECGFGKEARAIADASEAGDEAEALSACPDEMVEKFAIVGTTDEVRARVAALDDFTDSFTLCAPLSGVPPEMIGTYNQRTAEAFYA